MEYTRFNDHFRAFPYRADYADGRTNNGGIDLVKEPHRLTEITEAANFPELRLLLEELNSDRSRYMTLGCDAGFSNNAFFGYVEFSFRDPRYAIDEQLVAGFDSAFYGELSRQNPEMLAAIKPYLRWEYSPFCLETEERLMIAFYYCAKDQHSAGQLLDVFRRVLMSVPLPTGT